MPYSKRRQLIAGIAGMFLLVLGTSVHAEETVTLLILTPEAGAEFHVKDDIHFAGRAFLTRADGTREAIPADSLGWTSNIDGSIGEGSSFAVRLSVGSHTITLSINGSDENISATSIPITVVP